MLIEIQFRTKLQHIWATAVETMGVYTRSSLKSNVGDPSILRFFALVSSVFAIQEQTNIVPETNSDYNCLVDEIKYINNSNKILETLQALSQVMQYTNGDGNGYYILILNYDKMTLHIRQYPKSEIYKATNVYNEIEAWDDNNIDVVLVSASSLHSLRVAYPNYFSDISAFIKQISEIL